jgi:hypothetical protein
VEHVRVKYKESQPPQPSRYAKAVEAARRGGTTRAACTRASWEGVGCMDPKRNTRRAQERRPSLTSDIHRPATPREATFSRLVNQRPRTVVGTITIPTVVNTPVEA